MIYDREVKRDAYLQIGVREVWLVDCERRVVLVSQPGAAPDVVQKDVLLLRPPVTPEPASIDLAEIVRGWD